MSEEVREPRKTLPRAIYGAAALIAAMYIIATVALLVILPAESVDVRNGVFQAISGGSAALGIAWFGILAALLVTVGNAGGVGATVAGVARVPFVVGIDRYLPPAFGRLHPRWGTPHVAILTQGIISGAILLIFQINTTTRAAYQGLVDAAIILYFLPFLYMYAAVIRLASRPDGMQNSRAVLIPGGRLGVAMTGRLVFAFTVFALVLSFIACGDV